MDRGGRPVGIRADRRHRAAAARRRPGRHAAGPRGRRRRRDLRGADRQGPGCHRHATASERNHGYLRSIGAIPVAYGNGLAERVRAAAPRGVDATLDAAGTEEALRASLELVDKDRIGTVAFSPAARELDLRHITTERSASQLAGLLELYTADELRIVIQDQYPLERASRAHRAVETRHVRGKVVLTA